MRGVPKKARLVGEALDQILLFEWNRAARAHVALAAVPLSTRPRKHPVSVSVVEGGKVRELRARLRTRWIRYPRAEVRIHEKTKEERALERQRKAERMKRLGLWDDEKEPLVRPQRVRDAYDSEDDDRRWRLPFYRPLTSKVTEAFGVRRKYFKLRKGKIIRRWRGRHMGLDLDGDGGEPIHAVTDGVVAVAGRFKSQGRAVYVRHGDDFFTAYFHMSRILVKNGQRVRRGQVLGKVGATGLATGPHLHLMARVNGYAVDPMALLRLFGGPLGAGDDGAAKESAATPPR